MVHVPTRGDVPVRLGPGVALLPDYGPSTMDADVYLDPVRFELEREHVLGTHWLLAGRSEQVAEPGDWLTYEGHGETVVVTRQPDGSLAAFHNVCQHRGPAIVGEAVGCGARRFTCPYHGWVYDTTGLVVGVPDRDDFDPDHLDGLRARPSRPTNGVAGSGSTWPGPTPPPTSSRPSARRSPPTSVDSGWRTWSCTR